MTPPARTDSAGDPKKRSPAYMSAAQQFCSNIGPVANDARAAWQRRTLADLEKEIAERVARLEEKIAEHNDWLSKRQEFAASVSSTLVQVFVRMKPEAAALQLSEMDDNLAAALVMKIDPKIAASILAEVPAAKGAQISRLLLAAAASGGKSNGPADLVPARSQLLQAGRRRSEPRMEGDRSMRGGDSGRRLLRSTGRDWTPSHFVTNSGHGGGPACVGSICAVDGDPSREGRGFGLDGQCSRSFS